MLRTKIVPPPSHPDMNYVLDIRLVALRGHILSGILPPILNYMVCLCFERCG